MLLFSSRMELVRFIGASPPFIRPFRSVGHGLPPGIALSPITGDTHCAWHNALSHQVNRGLGQFRRISPKLPPQAPSRLRAAVELPGRRVVKSQWNQPTVDARSLTHRQPRCGLVRLRLAGLSAPAADRDHRIYYCTGDSERELIGHSMRRFVLCPHVDPSDHTGERIAPEEVDRRLVGV